MASKKSGPEFHNNGPFSYLDDVPFKIGEKFRSPAKVCLPIGFSMPDYTELLLYTQYDFFLEKKAVEMVEEDRQVKLAQKAAKLKAEAATTIAKSESIPEESKDVGFSEGSCSMTVPLVNPLLATLHHGSILTPTPANNSAIKQKNSSPPNSKSNFNLADFESEEDLFDKLELKTINEKEELKNILQFGTSGPGANLSEDNSAPCADSVSGMNTSKVHISTDEVVLECKSVRKPNGLVTLTQLVNCEKPLSSKVSLPPITSVSSIKSLSFPKLDIDETEQNAAKLMSTFHSTTCLPTVPFVDSKNFSQSKPSGLNGYHISGLPSSSVNLGTDTGTAPVSSFSGPTLLSIVSSTGTVAVNSTNNTTALVNSQNNMQSNGNTTEVSYMSHSSSPFHNLTSDERHCAETVIGMGYSFEKVHKAIQKHGHDVEQVLDYLVAHGRLCEKGFEPALVEEGLEIFQCSEEKTTEFLTLVYKFKEMGFEQKDIKEVLLKHSNNQEKALEDLMTLAAAS
ncbi:ubiquitin-associated protein 1 [Protopterus annectens]|uniref:ubiquitin-associated protein 1 n=1 Tax=Protopterus annectens TaxID=7888 RepID=UPI001CFA6B39|nr:ubiquitin-associated protein 1 [Protopterus annectens]